MRMNNRKIHTKFIPSMTVTNCPRGVVDAGECAECPLGYAEGGRCVYRIVKIKMVYDQIKDGKSGQTISVWRFECVHCGHTAAIFNTHKNLIDSRGGSCARCLARYVYYCGCGGDQQDTFKFMVSKPFYKVRKGKAAEPC